MQGALFNKKGKPIARLSGLTFEASGQCTGQIEFICEQPELQALLSELKTLASGQSLALIDEVWDKINAFKLSVTTEQNNKAKRIDYLYVENGEVSFRFI